MLAAVVVTQGWTYRLTIFVCDLAVFCTLCASEVQITVMIPYVSTAMSMFAFVSFNLSEVCVVSSVYVFPFELESEDHGCTGT